LRTSRSRRRSDRYRSWRFAAAGDSIHHPGREQRKALASATGFVSTAGDLARFFNALDPAAKESDLSVRSGREMARSQWAVPHVKDGRSYGLGIIIDRGRGDLVRSCGRIHGVYKPHLDGPRTGVTVSILTNAIDGLANTSVEADLSICNGFSQLGALRAPPPMIAIQRNRAPSPLGVWQGQFTRLRVPNLEGVNSRRRTLRSAGGGG
jgi:hypothetical protein